MFRLLRIIVKDLNGVEEDPKNIQPKVPITQLWEKREEDQGCTMQSNSLGYKIKYLAPRTGHSFKRPMYEIKPGVWVTRAKVPGTKEKKWHHNNKWNNREYGYIMNMSIC